MLNNLSLFFSSSCNFNCVYCTINKHRSCMDKNNREIRAKIESGEYAQNVIDKFSHLKDDMNEISLWGMEPTINSDMFGKLLLPLLDYFPNVSKISFSTNAWLGFDYLKRFIDFLNGYSSRDINLDIQLSIDGPSWITDPSRKNGAADNVVSVAEKIIAEYQDKLHFDLQFHTKPTVDMEFIRKMITDRDMLLEWYHFFDNTHDRLVSMNHDNHISVVFNNSPTFVDPGFHTVQDGKDIAEFVRILRGLDDGQFKHFKHPLVWQLIGGAYNFLKMNGYQDYIHQGCCSAGRYTANVDMNGNLFGCHALFSYSFIDTDHIVSTGYLTHGDNDESRWQTNCQLWHEYPGSKERFADIVITSLATYGQIDNVYAKNEDMRSLLYWTASSMYCPFAGAEITSGVYVIPASYYRFFGNGLLQEAINYLKDCGMI